jgi:hypothetical protein
LGSAVLGHSIDFPKIWERMGLAPGVRTERIAMTLLETFAIYNSEKGFTLVKTNFKFGFEPEYLLYLNQSVWKQISGNQKTNIQKREQTPYVSKGNLEWWSNKQKTDDSRKDNQNQFIFYNNIYNRIMINHQY